jgi:hypothetical protein
MRRCALVLLLIVTMAGTTVAAPSSQAAVATVHPGVRTVTGDGQCTANFVFTDGRHLYLGQAAHCAGTGEATDTDGCTAASRPLGTKVQIDGATRPGVLAYSSWRTMQARRERDPNRCAGNDFALIRIDPADRPRVDPTMPVWGGPVGVGGVTRAGDPVYTYGNSDLRLGLAALSPKEGWSAGTDHAGWTHSVYTVTPGVPGDSGSGFLDGRGRAIGVLSTLNFAPRPASNDVADLAHALSYARAHGWPTLRLVPGRQPFST